MSLAERARQLPAATGRWLAALPPRAYLLAGWVVFILGSYPGYMSVDSALQLFDVRNGAYTDTYSPVMTGIWSVCEYVAAGPLPMLVLQSGLFLFGLAAILRTVLAPRAAALVAAGVLLFPPVFAPMAVIWRDSLLAGVLLAAVGAAIQGTRNWRIAAGVLAIVACSLRPEAVVVVLVLALAAVPAGPWWRRIALALAIAVGAGGIARLADTVLTDTETYVSRQSLMINDIVGIVRRGRITDEAKLLKLVEGLPLADRATFRERIATRSTALDWWPFSHGDRRIFEPITTDEEAATLRRAWQHLIASYPGAYYKHRKLLTTSLLGLGPFWTPIYDELGDPELMAPLHHRATTSDWQLGMQAFVRLFENTPLFQPWLYLVIAVIALVLARRQRLLRIFVASGLVYEVTWFVLAPAPDYRFSHWLVTVATISLATLAVARREAWRR